MRARIAVSVLCLGIVGPVFGQVSTVPRNLGADGKPTGTFQYSIVPMATGCDAFAASPLDPLTEGVNGGNAQAVQAYGQKLLNCVAGVPDLKGKLGNLGKDYYHLIWEGRNDEDKPAVFRVLIHKGMQPSQTNRLPGLKGSATPLLIDVFMSPDKTARLTSLYVSTPKPNPTTSILPDIVHAVGLPGLVSSILPLPQQPLHFGMAFKVPLPVPPPADKKDLHVTLFAVELPFPRADLKIRDVATTPASVADFKDALVDLQKRVDAREARDSACARRLAAVLVEKLEGASVGCDQAASCSKKMQDIVEAETTKGIAGADCKDQTGPSYGYDPPLAVEKQFAALAGDLKADVTKNASDERNEPLTSISFGIASGLIFGQPSLKTARVGLDAGTLVSNPLPRELSMMTVNLHRPFDAELPRMSSAERLALFGGLVLSPSPGLTVGGSMQIIRGLSINLGHAWLVTNTLKGGDQLGSAPSDKLDPFKRQTARVSFLALGYTFKP